jgi:periplasmic mercuric ion binding protein
MKNLILLITTVLLFIAASVHAQTVKETIKVNGNCATCEKHIEKAAKAAGADNAKWDMDTKMLTVSFDEKKTSDDAIQKKIASVGYDTEKYTGDDKAYNNLDECCQYDRKKSPATKKAE